jgi:hypothetical protein
MANWAEAGRKWTRLAKRGWSGILEGPLSEGTMKGKYRCTFKKQEDQEIGLGISAEEAIVDAVNRVEKRVAV